MPSLPATRTVLGRFLLFLFQFPLTGAPLAWISNERAVTVTDTATDEPVATLKVGARPRGIEVSADGKRVYVALSDTARNTKGAADAIVALDPQTRKVVARYDAGSDPERFVVSRDGSRLYSSNEDAGTATVTDVKTKKAIATLIVGIEPEGVALSPDARRAYVTAEIGSSVIVVDVTRHRVTGRIELPRASPFRRTASASTWPTAMATPSR